MGIDQSRIAVGNGVVGCPAVGSILHHVVVGGIDVVAVILNRIIVGTTHCNVRALRIDIAGFLGTQRERRADAKREVAPRQVGRQAARPRIVAGADVEHVVFPTIALRPIVVATFLVGVESRCGVDTRQFAGENLAQRVVHVDVAKGRACGRLVLCQHVLVVGNVSIKAPSPVLGLQGRSAEHQLEALVHLLGSVVALCGESRRRDHQYRADQVVALTAVEREVHVQAVLQEAHIDAAVVVAGALPAQMGVGRIVDVAHAVGLGVAVAVFLLIVHDEHGVDALVDTAGDTRRKADGGVADDVTDALHPALLVHVPGQTEAPRHIELLLGAKVVATVGAARHIGYIAVHQHIVDSAIERGHRILNTTLFRQAVQDALIALHVGLGVGTVGTARQRQRHREIARHGVVAIYFAGDALGIAVAHLGTEEGTDAMNLAEGLTVVQLGTQLPVAVRTVGLCQVSVNTLGEHVSTLKRTVEPSGIAILIHLIVGGVGAVAVGGQPVEAEVLAEAPGDVATQHRRRTGAHHLGIVNLAHDVDTVLGQLAHHVAVHLGQREIGIVCAIGTVIVVGFLVGVGEVGVAEHVEYVAGACRQALQVAVGDVEVQRNGFRGVERELRHEVGTVGGRLLDNTIVGRHAAADVVGHLLRAAREAHAVRGAHGVAEQLLEPVGVGLLQLLDVGILLVGAHALELSVARAYLTDDADTGEPRAVLKTLLRELVPDALLVGQLFLCVHEIMVARGSRLHGDVAAVADVNVARLPLLGGDDDDARLRLRTVDGSGGSVLQHGDALDVLGCNASHTVGVEGGKVAGADIRVTHDGDVLLQRHAIDHPQRLVVAGDRGRTANADFGTLARSAADGLHVDTR